MSDDQETFNSCIIRKAMAYDLLITLEKNGSRTYTTEEVKQLIKTYIDEYLKEPVS